MNLLTELPCPFCSIDGVLTPLSTRNAETLSWSTPDQIRFHRIPCPTCGRLADFGFTREERPVLS